MLSTADILKFEHATRAHLFDGEVSRLLSRHNRENSPLPTQIGAALTGLLVSYNEHKIGMLLKTGSDQLPHIKRLGVIKEQMREIADSDSASLLRAADANIEKVLKGFRTR